MACGNLRGGPTWKKALQASRMTTLMMVHGVGCKCQGIGSSMGMVSLSTPTPRRPHAGNYQVFLHLGAVCCTCHAFLNGHSLGFSTDSKLPVEFNVTKYLRSGQNLLALRVLCWGAAAYLEDQDMWWFAGITRDVYLYARPKEHIRDIEVQARSDGKLELQADMACDGSMPRCGALQCTLFHGADRVIDFEMPFLVGQDRAIARQSVALPHAKLWSAEAPYLYKLVVKKNGSPAETEAVCLNVGFRTVEILEGRLLLNGRNLAEVELLESITTARMRG
eukprot:g18298.t1